MFKDVCLRAALAVVVAMLGACATQGPQTPATHPAQTRGVAGPSQISEGVVRNSDAARADPTKAPTGPDSASKADIGSAVTVPLPSEIAFEESERGKASWYGPRFHGRRTANGERYDQHAMTAAHKTLPFGTLVRVRSIITGKEIEVRINDRGPFVRGRIIDVSRAAAQALGLIDAGVETVLLLKPASAPFLLRGASAARLTN